MALLHASHPPAQTYGGEDILYIFFFLSWTPSSGPHYKSLFAPLPPLAAPCYKNDISLCVGFTPRAQALQSQLCFQEFVKLHLHLSRSLPVTGKQLFVFQDSSGHYLFC